MNKFASSEWCIWTVGQTDEWSERGESERTCKTRIRSLWTSIQKPAHAPAIIYHKILSIGRYTGSFQLSSSFCILICTQYSSYRNTKSSKLWYIRCIDSYRYIVNDLRNHRRRRRRSKAEAANCWDCHYVLNKAKTKTWRNRGRNVNGRKIESRNI